MNINVTAEKVCIAEEDNLNRGEYNIHKCKFNFSKEYEDLIKVAVFTNVIDTYEVNIENDECIIPYDVLKDEGVVTLGVYGYKEESEELQLRYSPKPAVLRIEEGSYIQDTSDPSIPETSRYLLPDNIKQGANVVIQRDGNDITINSLGGGSGGGDMYKLVYDTNDDGIVDNAEKVNGHTVEKDVPADAEFTDTIYNDTEIKELINGKQDELESGVNIKTINNQSILGEGNINIEGGGGSSSLTSDLIVSNPLGKYGNGDKIDEGTALETIFRGILSKTYYPTLSDPNTNLNYSSNALYKVGAVIAAKNATVSFNRGSINPKYTAESSYRSGEATSYKLDITGSSDAYSQTQDNGTFAVPALTRTSKGNIVLTARVDYAAGCQPKDSDGNNYQSPLPAGYKTASKTIEFILPFYYGASNTTDITSLEGLTEDLSKKANKTYRITTAAQHMVIAYDSSYGNLTSILDSNNFELINGWTKTTKTIDGQSYNIWTSNGKTTDTNAQFIFKF